ncbi:hypothetical protein CTAYLR_008632 [Chrysophaeum taylorii]|uniref:MRG domain-containing protein n=1 Tax=Chrysophaeum taylorii TaxID=2483200 RepID=A0AAD7UHL9_9STRA|nr:hypothetical protein CTAYLR_008632 [Chrysophaeum taylorii]
MLWAVGDEIECQVEGEWYPVKILKCGKGGYLVHFKGWNARHDAWVEASRLKSDEPPAKRMRETARIKLPLPRELKEQLVSDWEQITLEPRKWVPLPRSPTVREIVESFVLAKREQRWHTFGDAILEYFNKALPKILLYRYEREQFDRVKSGLDASGVYGAEHLVRLFAKLPELLVMTNLGPQDLQQTKAKLADFCKHLVKNKSAFFLPTYELREKLLEDDDDEDDDDDQGRRRRRREEEEEEDS